MPQLSTQQEFRHVRDLPFCYLCGKQFAPGDSRNKDHLPPSSMFEQADRDIPLILPTHMACNAKEQVSDELMGQFVALIHNRPLAAGHNKLDVTVVQTEGKTVGTSIRLNMQHFLVRCVRGFHAALYREWLPAATRNALHPPLRGAQLDGDTGKPIDEVQAMFARNQGIAQHMAFSKALKENRVAQNTDRVVSRNGKCVYECVWCDMENGLEVCIFGLKIYEWQQFDELAGYPPRGCVGIYHPETGRPETATKETGLHFSFSDDHRLDPFGQ